MNAPHKIRDLEVVGYATVLKETMLPTVVPPVFRIKAEPTRILFPPYTFSGDLLWNAGERNKDELQKFVDDGEVTLLGYALPAQPDFCLWVFSEKAQPHLSAIGLNPRYEPRRNAFTVLRRIAEESIQQARAAFAQGNNAEADRLCGTALSADDHLVEALVIKAAVCRRAGDVHGERVMANLASKALGAEPFECLVCHFAGPLPPPAEPASDGSHPPTPGIQMGT